MNPDATATPLARPYWPQLDGLRALAFLMVFGCHLPRMHGWWGEAQRVGAFGVDVFFALSAFLIFSMLQHELHATGRVDVWRFYVRRARRIWPLYFPYLLIALIALPSASIHQASTIADHALPLGVFLGNLSNALAINTATKSIVHLWSISYEEQLYLVAPLLVALAGVHLRRYAIQIAMAAMFWGICTRLYLDGSSIIGATRMQYTLPIFRIEAFALGVAIAHSARARAAIDRAWYAAPLGTALILLLTLAPDWKDRQLWWQLTISGSAAALLLAGALRGGGWLGAALSAPPLRWLGRISYGLYVFHMPVIELVPFAPAALAITIALAAASYYGWERRWLRDHRSTAAVTTAPAASPTAAHNTGWEDHAGGAASEPIS